MSTLGELADALSHVGAEGSSSSTVSVDGDSNTASSSTTEVPPYAFTTPQKSWSKKLKKDAPMPSFLEFPLDSGYSLTERNGTVEWQFYLGPLGSGAPVHFHGHAANTLMFGEKVSF